MTTRLRHTTDTVSIRTAAEAAIADYRDMVAVSAAIDRLDGATWTDPRRIQHDNDVRLLLSKLLTDVYPRTELQQVLDLLADPDPTTPTQPLPSDRTTLYTRWQELHRQLAHSLVELGGLDHLLARERAIATELGDMRHAERSA